MHRIFFASICLMALAANPGFTEETAPLALPPTAAPRSSISLNAESHDQAVGHLLKAADHLEAAGLDEEASKLRHEARRRALHENVLSRKESELECLQEEVDRLRALMGQTAAVQIEIVAIEVDRKKLGLRAAEFDKMIGSTPASAAAPARPPETSGIVEANPALLPLFKELRERGILKVLAQPTLITTSGRPANFHDGGEAAVRVKSPGGEISTRNLRYGTELEVVAVVRPNQRIRLQTAFELREMKADVNGDDGTAPAEVRSRRLNTEVEMQLGQTLTLGRLILPRSNGPEVKGNRGERKGPAQPAAESVSPVELIETIVFVTPRLLHGAILPRAAEIVPAEEELQDDDTLQPIVPAAFDPTNASEFGPAIPILKRRTVRD